MKPNDKYQDTEQQNEVIILREVREVEDDPDQTLILYNETTTDNHKGCGFFIFFKDFKGRFKKIEEEEDE